MHILQSLLGIAVFIFFAWLMSERRQLFPWRLVAAGLVTQCLLAALLLHLSFFRTVFVSLNNMLLSLQQATHAGTAFVFGYLGGGSLPFESTSPGAGFILAFQALPLVLVVSALSSLLFYWRILPLIVNGFSKLLQKALSIGGALGVGASANVFVGMIEAPLFVRPYLPHLSRAELFALMTTGMATIAGTVLVLYAGVLAKVLPDAMGHLLTASIISVPAAILLAYAMVPHEGEATEGDIVPAQQANSSMEAITQGTLQGVQLLINIVAMLVVLVALVSLLNIILGLLPDVAGQPITLQRLLGYVMAPLVWLMGVPWSEALTAGSLMGIKTVLNEFIAYLEMSKLPDGALSERSRYIMMYAMCGFANFGSLGIMLGGLITLVPERRAELVELGMKSIVAGTLATMMTGCIVGIFL
jgi:CNT family concentrative nucleoside transporter